MSDRPQPMNTRGPTILLLLAALSGCTVGPDFTSPRPPMSDGYSGLSLAGGPGAISRAVPGPTDVSRWWRSLNDEALTSLIERATVDNLAVQQAFARIRQARASLRIAGAAGLPTLDATGSADRSRSRSNSIARTDNFFRAGFDASWELDVFGGIARSVEAADESLLASVEDRRAVQASLAAEVATTYIELRALQRRLALARKNLALQEDTASLTSERFEAGFVGSLDLANARALVASTASRLPSLEADIRTRIYALSVLIATPPETLLAELSPDAPLPSPPAAVPVGLPSELLLRRPDIRRAEATLAAQSARIGVAVADLYPRFSLTGSFGLQGPEVSSLGSLAQRYWSIGPSVRWNVFDAGRIRGNIDLQRALFDEQLAGYKQTVLTALQDVESSLVGFAQEQHRRLTLIDSVRANTDAVSIANELYIGGRTDFLNVLSAQGRLLDAEDALVVSEQAITANLVALYKALGGGWNPDDAATPLSGTEPLTPATPPLTSPQAPEPR